MTFFYTVVMQRLAFADLGTGARPWHLARVSLGPLDAVAPHAHDFYEFFLVLRGSGHHHLNGRDVPLLPHLLTWIRPPDVHSLHPQHSLEIVNLAARAPWIRRLSHVFSLPTPPQLATRLLPADAASLLHHLDQLALEPDAATLPRLALAFAEAARLLTQPRTPIHHKEEPDWLRRWVTQLDRPERFALSVPQASASAGRSPEHLARSTALHYSCTPTELVLRSRIRWIQTQLLRTSDKAEMLALDAGFQNLGYFYRVFRRLTGCTPGQWRSTHRSNRAFPATPARLPATPPGE